jgi:hypothetical protein
VELNKAIIRATLEAGITSDKVKNPWSVKLGRRSKRMDKWEQQWYTEWGLSKECRICGDDHAAMNKLKDEEGKITYSYNCPIAMQEHWPVRNQEKENGMWGCLEANPLKVSSHNGFSYEAITEALFKWENRGSGSLLTNEERESFKGEVFLSCDAERQSWSFKRTLPNEYVVGNEIC